MFIFIPFYQAFSDLYVKQNYAEGNVNFTLIEENALFLFTNNNSIIIIWVFVIALKVVRLFGVLHEAFFNKRLLKIQYFNAIQLELLTTTSLQKLCNLKFFGNFIVKSKQNFLKHCSIPAFIVHQRSYFLFLHSFFALSLKLYRFSFLSSIDFLSMLPIAYHFAYTLIY